MCVILQETYPSTPPVWFADSEDTNVTNAIQVLGNTNGLENHVINQVRSALLKCHVLTVNSKIIILYALQVIILLKELCRIHCLPLPNELHNLVATFNETTAASAAAAASSNYSGGYKHAKNNSSQHNQDHDIDTDPEDVIGESDQDSDAEEEDLPLELDDGRSANKKDEMEVEHLATLERLRQTQRQDYLRVSLEQSDYIKTNLNLMIINILS